MQLTQKETNLLNDLASQEELCVAKYQRHAASAIDIQLKDLLNSIATVEKTHLDTINQLKGGVIPPMGQGSAQQPTFKATYTADTDNKKSDAYLCEDLLATEKHASHLYDTSIFEFADTQVRDILNHIQKEEQGHGKNIYDYMKVNGMY